MTRHGHLNVKHRTLLVARKGTGLHSDTVNIRYIYVHIWCT